MVFFPSLTPSWLYSTPFRKVLRTMWGFSWEISPLAGGRLQSFPSSSVRFLRKPQMLGMYDVCIAKRRQSLFLASLCSCQDTWTIILVLVILQRPARLREGSTAELTPRLMLWTWRCGELRTPCCRSAAVALLLLRVNPGTLESQSSEKLLEKVACSSRPPRLA